MRVGRVASAKGNGGAGSRSLVSGQGRLSYVAVSGGKGVGRNDVRAARTSTPAPPTGHWDPGSVTAGMIAAAGLANATSTGSASLDSTASAGATSAAASSSLFESGADVA